MGGGWIRSAGPGGASPGSVPVIFTVLSQNPFANWMKIMYLPLERKSFPTHMTHFPGVPWASIRMVDSRNKQPSSFPKWPGKRKGQVRKPFNMISGSPGTINLSTESHKLCFRFSNQTYKIFSPFENIEQQNLGSLPGNSHASGIFPACF